jgi:probable rRNA maturation factor
MLQHLELDGVELSLTLCDDATIHELNRVWRRKDRPTDVLAFSQREGEAVAGGGEQLGDVVISADTARRQAAARRHPLLAELTFLLAHGLLHLLGYDHRTRAEERVMDRLAGELCRAAAARTRPARRSRRRG